MRTSDRLGIAFGVVSALVLTAGTALATPQFTPSGSARVHTLSSGEPGINWTTAGLGVNGQIEYVAGTTTLTMGAEIQQMNWYGDAGCPTDAGSNCSFNFGPALDLAMTAQYLGFSVVANGGGNYAITLDFESAPGSSPDITWTDPADGNSVQLQASWTSGTFSSIYTPGLQVSGTYCDGVGGAVRGAERHHAAISRTRDSGVG
jgi:hypothetical protein